MSEDHEVAHELRELNCILRTTFGATTLATKEDLDRLESRLSDLIEASHEEIALLQGLAQQRAAILKKLAFTLSETSTLLGA